MEAPSEEVEEEKEPEEAPVAEEPSPEPEAAFSMRITEERSDYMEIEVSGEDPGVLGALSEVIRGNDEVEYSGFRIDHPLTDKAYLTIKTRGKGKSAREALEDSLVKLKLTAEELLKLAAEIETS